VANVQTFHKRVGASRRGSRKLSSGHAHLEHGEPHVLLLVGKERTIATSTGRHWNLDQEGRECTVQGSDENFFFFWIKGDLLLKSFKYYI
jgi:hypothetical protein